MLSDKLKELRKIRGVTQEQLAAAINVERSSVGKYESPTKPVNPSPEVLLRIANYFDISLDSLHGREQEKKPAPENEDRLDAEVYELISGLSPDQIEAAKSYLRFLKAQEGNP